MVNIECGFQNTPQPDVYAVDTKFPTPDQMVANHDRLLVMLSGQRNKDGSSSNTPEFLAGFFGYSVDRVDSLIAEAASPIVCQPKELKAAEPLTVIPSTVPAELPTPEIIVESPAVAAEIKEKELIPGERAYLLGVAYGNFPAKRDTRTGEIVIRTESRDEAARKYLRETVGTEGEMRESLNRLRIDLKSPKFDFMVDPSVKDEMLWRADRFAPFLLGLMNARGIDQDGRLSHHNIELLKKIALIYPAHFEREIGTVKMDNRKRNVHAPYLHIEDVSKVYADLFRVFSVRMIPFVKDLPGYPEEK